MEEICHLDANAPARISDLECKIIDLKAQLHMSQEELSGTKVRQDVSVIVNGHRYKVL